MTIDKSHTIPDESQANAGKSQNGPDSYWWVVTDNYKHL